MVLRPMPRQCALHMALQALERQQPMDDAERCTLLLALGEAQTKAAISLRLVTHSSALLTSPGH